MATTPPPPSSGDLERERLELDRRRLALDESWPRKWGAVLLTAGATVSAAIVTGGLGYTQQRAAVDQARAAQERQEKAEAARMAEAARQRSVENNRTALDMYFRFVADKPDGAPHRIDHIRVIQSVADNRRLLSQLTAGVIEARGEKAPSEVLAGLADVKPQPRDRAYKPSDFVAYVQYFEPRRADAGRLAAALAGLGFRVPDQQAMPAAKSPRDNQIRIYRAEHRPYAIRLDGELRRRTGLTFAVRGPIGGQLPNGVVELWLGQSGAETVGAVGA